MGTAILERKVMQLPFEVHQEVSDYLDFLLYKYRNPRKPIKQYAGCMKGTFIRMSDDFNEPLDDFKEYM